MTILSLNKILWPTPIVSLNVITAVINKTNNEILWTIFEPSFLKTPKISKNIIDNEIKISGNIKFYGAALSNYNTSSLKKKFFKKNILCAASTHKNEELFIGKVHKELKKYGGVKPPREFVFMDRAAVGLGSIFIHLKAEINWYRLFHELIRDFSVTNVEKSQKKALKAAGI